MAVSTTVTTQTFNGNDTTGPFAISTFVFFQSSDLVFTHTSSSGTTTSWTVPTHLSITGGADADGLPSTGNITTVSALASGETLRVDRATAKTQSSVFSDNDAFPAKTIEAALDRAILVAQESASTGTTESALTDAASIAWDMAPAFDFVVTLAGNRALENPTNVTRKRGYIRVVQDATGSRTLSFGSNYEFAGGTAPTLSTTANAEDLLEYTVLSPTRIFIRSALNIS